MASFQPASPGLSARDVLAFSDADLIQYMERNRRSDGDFDPDIVGWDLLPDDQRAELAERLKFGARKADDGIRSRPIDLNQLTSRLLEAAADDTSPRAMPAPRRRERSPTGTPPGMDEYRELERWHYNALVNDGGQPCYPIALLEDVSENPKAYRTILRPWQQYPDTTWPSWEVFDKQNTHWDDFRRWQLVNRGIYDSHSEYLAFLEKHKSQCAAGGLTEDLAEFEADPSCFVSLWKRIERERDRDYSHLWWVEKPKPTGIEEGDTEKPAAPDADHYDVFPIYVEKVKRRLAQHGFTRTFQLEKDPKQQDRLTTWIEYLNYEYSWYDQYARYVKRLQPQHDTGWKKLVDSGVLRPWETEEYLLTDECSSRHHGEWTAARRALDTAKAAAEAAIAETDKAKNGRGILSTSERKRGLAKAHSNFAAADKAWKSVKRRLDTIDEFIVGIRDYRVAKDDEYRQGILLQWVLEQIPLIETELNESKVAVKSEPGVADTPALKRTTNAAPSSRLMSHASRKTRDGRITKNASQRRGDGTRSTQSRHFEGRAAPQTRRKQRKTYEKERASRRLAGNLPEFVGLGAASSPYESPRQQTRDTGKAGGSVPRRSRRSKNPTVIKGAKPQGISKSRSGSELKARRIPQSSAT